MPKKAIDDPKSSDYSYCLCFKEVHGNMKNGSTSKKSLLHIS